MLIRSALSLSLWAVRRCSPSCRSCYRSVIRLIPLLGYSGERPRLRRACKHPRNSAELLQQSSIVRKQCSSFRAVRILSSSLEALCSLRLMQLREQIALHVVHHARLAKSPLRYPSGFMQPSGHVCGVCCPQAPHSILNFLA
nr:MAG TPA: hypothetical protein [Caudoviricetes sp.]